MENSLANKQTVEEVKGKIILIVEDDEFLAKLLAKKISKAGYVPVSVETGEEALKTLAASLPDLIILDILLPGMSGFDLLENIHEDQRFRKIPTIFLTNLGSREKIEKGLALGAKRYFVKAAIDLSEVITSINSLLNPK